MKQDARQQDVSESAGRSAGTQHATRPAPGKVTRTSGLTGGGGQAVQRQALASSGAPSTRRSALASLDADMDAAHRGLTALADQPVQLQQIPQGAGTQTAPQATPQIGPQTAPQAPAAVDVATLIAGLQFTAPVVSTANNTLGITEALTWIESVQQRLQQAIQAHDALPADHADRGRLAAAIAAGANQAAGLMTTMANTIRTTVESLLRQSSPVNSTPAQGETPAQPPPQATLPGSTEVDRLRTAAAGLSRSARVTSGALGGSGDVLVQGAGSVADAALSIYQGLGVLSARGDWVTGYRQDSISTTDAATQGVAERELRRRQGARDGLNAVFADSGFNRYGVQPVDRPLGNNWEPHDWCGMFVGAHLFRSAGLDGELRAGFFEVNNVNDFFNYTQRANASRIPVTVWVPEENRWMDLRTYHQLRGSERTWLSRAAIQAEIDEGKVPFRSGDVCLINHRGGDVAQHIVMVDSYDPTTGELRTIEGNTLGIRSNAQGMAARNRQGELASDSGQTTVGIHIRQMDGTAERREGSGAYQNRAGNTVLGRGRLSAVDFEDHRYSTLPLSRFPEAARQLSPDQMNAAARGSQRVAGSQVRGTQRQGR